MLSPETALLAGKVLETVGAIGLAGLGIRAAALEYLVGRHLRRPNDAHNLSLQDLGEALRKLNEHRENLFGPKELYIVAVSAVLVAAGCGLYLWALLVKPH